VLHLGNVQFRSDGGDGSAVANRPQLELVARLLQVDVEALSKALTVRVNKIRGETIGTHTHTRTHTLYARCVFLHRSPFVLFFSVIVVCSCKKWQREMKTVCVLKLVMHEN
jgi:hypothetical protein